MRTLLKAACAALAIAGAPAHATIWNLTASADGLQETPPNASPGSGLFQATYDDVTNAMSWTFVWGPLIGTAIAAHIHGPAPAGSPAAVIVPLAITTAVFAASDAGALVFPQLHEASLLSGLTYVNLHTTVFGGGEIRGQIAAAQVAEPATLAISALALAAFGVAQRRRYAASRENRRTR